jgi:hypothetical protein
MDLCGTFTTRFAAGRVMDLYSLLLHVLSDKSATLCTCCEKGRDMGLRSTFTTCFVGDI